MAALPRHDIPLLVHDRPHLCRMHPQYGALGLVDDGRPHEAPEHPPVADGERSRRHHHHNICLVGPSAAVDQIVI